MHAASVHPEPGSISHVKKFKSLASRVSKIQVRSQTQSNVNVFSASVNLLGLVRSENILKTVLKRFVPVFLKEYIQGCIYVKMSYIRL